MRGPIAPNFRQANSISSLTETLIIVALIGLLVVIGKALYEDVTSDHFQLKKSEWQCVDHRTESQLQTTIVGKTVLLVPTTVEQCVKYQRQHE